LRSLGALISLMRIVRFVAIILLGACLGAAVMVQICQPVKLMQENSDLQADVRMLSTAYTREFTRNHIMPFTDVKHRQNHGAD